MSQFDKVPNTETSAGKNNISPSSDVFSDLEEVYGEEIQKDKEMFETEGIEIRKVLEKDAIPNEHGEHNLPYGITP